MHIKMKCVIQLPMGTLFKNINTSSKYIKKVQRMFLSQQQSDPQDLSKCLSAEQQQALDIVKSGRNLFITGSAGVGKSFLLNELIKSQPKKGVYITASTGVAACNINGTTLHSFASIGLGDKPASLLAYAIMKKPWKAEAKKRWLNCRLLVIDEISMIDGGLFSTVEEIARIVRNSSSPFGGIQVILCGDFLQLPPVNVKKFAFETQAWKDVVHETVVLKKVFRQKLVGFISLLNRLRIGHLTSLDIDVLQHCKRTVFPNDGIKATRLFPHKASCDQLNQAELLKLPGPMVTFEARDWFKDSMGQEQLAKNCRYVKVLNLKVGAQVMLLNNQSVSDGLVNGARGVVTGFKSKKKEIEDTIKEFLDNNGVDAMESEYGEHLAKKFQECENEQSYPIVKFVNNMELVITPDQITTEVTGVIISYRIQLPLALAWAVSIHKAQGMTLERVELSIAKAFEHGQAYVALSRVTSLDGLLLRDFDSTRVSAHPSVIRYYKQIDPLFDSFTQAGEEELKDFISFKKIPKKIQNEQKIETNDNILPSDQIYQSINIVDSLKASFNEEALPTSLVLKRAEEKLSDCRKALRNFADAIRIDASKNDFYSSFSPNVFTPLTPKFVAESSIDDMSQLLSSSSSASFEWNNRDKEKLPNEFNPIVIDSDDDFDCALFDDTNFDNDTVNTPSTIHSTNNFISNPCLKKKCEDSWTSNQPCELPSKRPRKSCGESLFQSVTDSNLEEKLFTNIEDKKYIKEMLVIKQQQIKENYNNALLRRLNSINKFK